MAHQLVDYGEEWLLKTDVTGVSGVNIGLYNDADDGADSSGDSVGDADDHGTLSSEPDTGATYSRQTGEAITVEQINGDWGFDNDSSVTFDTSGNSETVDSWFVTASFQASGDGSSTEHLIATGPLSQAYDLSNVDSLEISAGDGSGSGIGVTVN